MNNNNRISLLFLLTISMLILSCSKQKDYNADNNFLAYYNTFYSAKQNFDNAVEIISKSQDLSKPSASTIQLLDNAIKNASIIENKFYKTKYLDDAFYIIARSTYLKGKISASRYYFNKIVENYKDSQYYYESLIWLGFINIDLGKTDEINSIISQLEKDAYDLSDNLFLFYMLKAKASDFFDIPSDIKLNYLLAVENANNKFDKVEVYKKLLNVSEENNNYKDSAYYLESILYNIDDSSNDKNKLLNKWFYYNCLNGDYDKNYTYIEEKMSDNLSTIDEIFYKTQFAITLKYDAEYDESEEMFLDLIDRFHNPSASNLKPYFCDIHYHLGNLHLKHYGSFEEAKVYFDKCKNDCVGSEKAKIKAETQNHSEAIIELLSLDAEFEYVNEVKTEENNNENEEKNPYFIPMQQEKNENNVPEKILYEMGLVLLFKLGLTDSSLVKFKIINEKFPESDYAYKSLILLHELEPNEKWNQIIESEFSHLINLENEDRKIVNLRSVAWDKLDLNTLECINEFLSIFNQYNDSFSLYYAAYLYDQFLNDINNSLKYYRLYIENFPEDEFVQQITNRIDDIESLIEDEIKLFTKHIFYKTAYNMIKTNNLELDSVKFYLNNAKEIELTAPLNLNIDNFISFIDSYESNSDSTKVNSIEDYKQLVENNVLDSVKIDTFEVNDFYIEIDFELLHEKLSNVQNIKDKLFKAGCAYEDALNYDPDVRLDDGSCVYEITEGSFKWNQSMTQFFYFVEFATYDTLELTEDDWMVAYNDDIVVGARQYVINGNIDIPIMGDDGGDYSSGYCKDGNIPNIKVHRKSGEVISMNVEAIEGELEFQNNSHTIVRLSNK